MKAANLKSCYPYRFVMTWNTKLSQFLSHIGRGILYTKTSVYTNILQKKNPNYFWSTVLVKSNTHLFHGFSWPPLCEGAPWTLIIIVNHLHYLSPSSRKPTQNSDLQSLLPTIGHHLRISCCAGTPEAWQAFHVQYGCRTNGLIETIKFNYIKYLLCESAIESLSWYGVLLYNTFDQHCKLQKQSVTFVWQIPSRRTT